jgi:fructose-1,6-bisphosphatase/inositol monophosphatase family enzyme
LTVREGPLLSAVDPQKIVRLMAEVAAEEIMPRFRNLAAGDIRMKDGNETVTVADEAAERALSPRLMALLPGSVVVGEEGAAADPGMLARLSGDAPVWVIDPIDGTRNYAAGRPVFGVMVALVRRNETVAAWIHRPIDEISFIAERGGGAWRNGVRLKPPAVPASDRVLEGSIRFNVFPEDRRVALRAKAHAGLGRVGSQFCVAREYGDMAEGIQHFALFSKLMPWDHVPGALLVEEAGGRVAKWDGSPYRPTDTAGGILAAASPEGWNRIREFLASP